MGYTTNFQGKFTITPALSPEHKAFLQAFAQTRRMRRDEAKAAATPDPIREAAGLPVGREGGYFVAGSGYGGGNDDSVIDGAQAPEGQPGLWCQWVPNKQGTALQWDRGEKFYNYVEWLRYLVEHFLVPMGYQAKGIVTWRGEDREDRGALATFGGQVFEFRASTKEAKAQAAERIRQWDELLAAVDAPIDPTTKTPRPRM